MNEFHFIFVAVICNLYFSFLLTLMRSQIVAYVNLITFNRAHTWSRCSRGWQLLIPKAPNTMGEKALKYLLNEIDSLELNCSWWCLRRAHTKNPFNKKKTILSWFGVSKEFLFTFVCLSFVLTFCSFARGQKNIFFSLPNTEWLRTILDDVTTWHSRTCWWARTLRQIGKLLRHSPAAIELENEQSRQGTCSNYTAWCNFAYYVFFLFKGANGIRLRLSTRVHFFRLKNDSINSAASCSK